MWLASASLLADQTSPGTSPVRTQSQPRASVAQDRAESAPPGGSLGARNAPESAAAGSSSGGDFSTADARILYKELNALRVDPEHVYQIRSIRLRRGPISLTLENGEVAFFTAFQGRVTGAVFKGQGHIIGTPRDPSERLSIAHYLKLPLVDLAFTNALFRFTDDTASELMHAIQSEAAGAHIDTVPDKSLSDLWDQVAEKSNPWQSRRILFDWLSTNPQPYFFGRFVSDAAGIFDVVVDPRREEPVFMGQPRSGPDGDFYDVWTSFTPENSHGQSETFLPVDYALDTAITDDFSLTGSATLHFKAARPGERMVNLELSRQLAVTSCTDEAGKPLEYFQNDDMSQRDLARHGNDQLLVALPTAPADGQEFRIKIAYHGNVLSQAKDGVYFAGERGSWYPRLSGPDRFVPFDLSFHWPKNLTLIATGDEINSSETNGQREGHWKTSAPLIRAGFNLGPYERQSTGGNEPKINVYADPQLQAAILAQLQQKTDLIPLPQFPERHHQPPIGETNLPIPEPLPPSDSKEALAALGDEVMASIRFFEKESGPFPFDRIDVSPIPVRFGEGWPGMLYLPAIAFLPQLAQQQIVSNPLAEEQLRDIIVPHEVAHQWWGNVVGIDTYRDTWIPEAMSNYLAFLYAGSKGHSDHLLDDWLVRYRDRLLAKSLDGRGTVEDTGPLTMGSRLESAQAPDAYNAIVYGKGMWVIHMLRTMMREPAAKEPDARFDDLQRYVLRQYRFQPLSTMDFQRAVQKFMTPAMDLEGNHTMDWFFDEWVRQTGIPHYSVEFTTKPRGQDVLVTGTLTQDNVPDDFIESVPLYATRPGGKPLLVGTVVTLGPETSFHFVSRVHPGKILIDPNLTLLCTTE